MNLYLVKLISKGIGILFVTFASFFGYEESSYVVSNTNKNKSLDVITEIVPYETETKYNDQVEKGKETVITEGENGYAVVNSETNEKKVIKPAVNKVIEIGTKEKPVVTIPVVTNSANVSADTIESFQGKITAYGGDCCGGSGNVAYVKHNLLTQGYYYQDKTYGNVRILSAAPQKFTPGTVMEVITPDETFYGIVLDWGGSMKNAWNRGEVWIDLAFSTQKEAMQYGTKYNVTFNVKRYGW